MPYALKKLKMVKSILFIIFQIKCPIIYSKHTNPNTFLAFIEILVAVQYIMEVHLNSKMFLFLSCLIEVILNGEVFMIYSHMRIPSTCSFKLEF